MKKITWLIAILFLILAGRTAAAQSNEDAVVRGVMFWSDTCPHCHYVIDEVLPPLQAQYGDQLDIVLIEIDTQANADRFYSAGAAFGIPRNEIGVPMMIVGDHLMFGSIQIPDELPGLIESYLAQGGVDIPSIDGLEGLSTLADGPQTPVPAGVGGVSGSILAFIVLAGLALALAFVGVRLFAARKGGDIPAMPWLWWAIPVLAVAGLVVAGYLTYVETQAVEAVCGPVGDCNAVQSSSYARFLGIPVGVIGLAGYFAILIAWVWGRSGDATARSILLAMTVIGVVASLYLTFLELFVIEAVCMWCLTSAVIMMGLMLAAGAWLADAWAPPKRRLRRRAAG